MARTLAIIIGVVFLIVGILGFIPNPIVGMDGYFMTNTAHDMVHLLSGLILLIVAFAAPMKSGLTLKIVGIVYLLVAILGLVMGGDSLLNLIAINGNDNWLHVVLAVVIFLAGFAPNRTSTPVQPMM